MGHSHLHVCSTRFTSSQNTQAILTPIQAPHFSAISYWRRGKCHMMRFLSANEPSLWAGRPAQINTRLLSVGRVFSNHVQLVVGEIYRCLLKFFSAVAYSPDMNHPRFIFIMYGQVRVHGRPNSDFYVCTAVTCSYQVHFKGFQDNSRNSNIKRVDGRQMWQWCFQACTCSTSTATAGHIPCAPNPGLQELHSSFCNSTSPLFCLPFPGRLNKSF